MDHARFLTQQTSARPRSLLAAVGSPPPDAILFGGGLPDPRTYPVDALERLLTETLRADGRGALGYDVNGGVDPLRAEIARHLTARDGHPVTAEAISVHAGAAGSMGALADLLIDPGDVVIVEAMTYPGAVKTFEQHGARIVPCPLDDGDGLRVDALDELLDGLHAEGARVKFVYAGGTFQNPTGSVLGADRRLALAAVADRHDVLLVQDDTYADLRYGPLSGPPLAECAPERALVVGSCSKAIAPGLRLGWVAAPPALAAHLLTRRTDLGPSPLLQHVVARYLATGEFAAHLEELAPHYLAKRDLLLDALDAHCADHATWTVPPGGYLLWMRLRTTTVAELTPHAQAHALRFLAGSYFAVGPHDDRTVRLAFGELSESELVEGTKRLGAALAAASTG